MDVAAEALGGGLASQEVSRADNQLIRTEIGGQGNDIDGDAEPLERAVVNEQVAQIAEASPVWLELDGPQVLVIEEQRDLRGGVIARHGVERGEVIVQADQVVIAAAGRCVV